MFYVTTSFNQPIGGWDVSSVTDMNLCSPARRHSTSRSRGWDVSSVTNMEHVLLRDIVQPADRGLGRVLGDSMYRMFQNAAFLSRIGGWNVSATTDQLSMFSTATAWLGTYVNPRRLRRPCLVDARPDLRGAGQVRLVRACARASIASSPRRSMTPGAVTPRAGSARGVRTCVPACDARRWRWRKALRALVSEVRTRRACTCEEKAARVRRAEEDSEDGSEYDEILGERAGRASDRSLRADHMACSTVWACSTRATAARPSSSSS